jgi:hypothetical protein
LSRSCAYTDPSPRINPNQQQQNATTIATENIVVMSLRPRIGYRKRKEHNLYFASSLAVGRAVRVIPAKLLSRGFEGNAYFVVFFLLESKDSPAVNRFQKGIYIFVCYLTIGLELRCKAERSPPTAEFEFHFAGCFGMIFQADPLRDLFSKNKLDRTLHYRCCFAVGWLVILIFPRIGNMCL